MELLLLQRPEGHHHSAERVNLELQEVHSLKPGCFRYDQMNARNVVIQRRTRKLILMVPWHCLVSMKAKKQDTSPRAYVSLSHVLDT